MVLNYIEVLYMELSNIKGNGWLHVLQRIATSNI